MPFVFPNIYSNGLLNCKGIITFMAVTRRLRRVPKRASTIPNVPSFLPRRIHTGVMPYSCAACGKHFRYKVTQRTHKCIAAVAVAAQESHSLLPDQQQQQQQQQQLPTLPPKIQEELRNFRKVKRPKIPCRPDYINDSPLSELGQLSLTENCGTSQEKCNEDDGNPFADFML